MSEGFLRRYRRTMGGFTDAPSVYHLAAAYAVYGALLSRNSNRLRIAAGPEPMWPNLWMVLVGGSAQSRKSTSIHLAQSIALAVDRHIIAPDSFTPEGFAQFLYQRQMTAGSGGPAALLTLTEMSQFLLEAQRQYASANKSMLMSMYDVKSFRRQLSKNTLEVKLPRVSLLGGIAPELLASHTDTADWQGGFMSRTMLIHGVRREHLEDPCPVPDETYSDLAKVLGERLSAQLKMRKAHKAEWAKKGFKYFVMDFDPDARKLWGKTPSSHEDPSLNFTLGRSKAHLAKMAAIEQVDRDPESPVITVPAVKAATELWQHWWDSSPDLVRSCFARSQADFGGDRLALRIFRILKDLEDRVDMRLVMRSAAVHSAAFNSALASLQQAGMIQVEVEKLETDRTFVDAGGKTHTTLEEVTYLRAVQNEGDAQALTKLSKKSLPETLRNEQSTFRSKTSN